MVTRLDEVGAGPLSDGWDRLADGDWPAARASFADAVARNETPEALEGLSWAAWWLDDADTVFYSRERAYHLYRRLGESASAARMAIWLSADQLDFRGAVAVAKGWLGRARPPEDGAPAPPAGRPGAALASAAP